MCYREDVPPLDLDGIGIACLSGENGAGKSALLDALTWALWGESRLKSDDELIALGAQEMEVDLTFALDGQDYRVIRKRSKGKRSGQSWLDFQIRNNGSWKTLTGATLRETQQIITSTLHMGYDTFANSAFLRQGHADEFTRKEPGKRKQVLAEILGLDIYEQLEGGAKDRAKGLDGQIKVLDGQIAELERQAEQRLYHLAEVDRAERRVEEIGAQLAQADAACEEATKHVQSLERLLPQRDDLRARLERLRHERDELLIAVEKLRRSLNEAELMVARRDEIRAGLATLRAAQAEVERLDGLRANYDALVEQRRHYDDTIREAERQLRTDLRLAEGELRGLRERAARRPQIEQEIAKLKQQLGGFASFQDELGKARARRNDLREQTREANELQLKRKDLDSQIKLKHDSLVATREELKRRLKDYAERLRPAERWKADHARAVTEIHRLEADVLRLDELRAVEHESVERVGALRAACDSIKTQGEEINRKLALLDQNAHACPLCGSELGHDGITHIEAEYERERKQLRANFSVANTEAKGIETSLQTLRSEIKALEASAAELPKLAAQIARFEGDLAMADDLRRRQSEDQRTLDDIQLQLVKGDYEHGIRAELARVEATISALGDPASLGRQMDQLENQIARLERQLDEQASVRAKIESFTRDLAAIDAETPALHEQEVHVTDLQNTLDMGDFARDIRVALARVNAEIDALGYSPEIHKSARDEARSLVYWDEEGRRLERSEERLASDQHALDRDEQSLKRRDDELESAVVQLNTLQQQLQELGPATRARDEANIMVQRHRRELSVADRDLGEKRALLQRAENAAAELFSCQERRKALTHRKGLFDELTTSFGKKGVQALLIETAIPEIEREANTLLGNMTDNQMHLSFETQRDTKKGDVSETLDIKIADALGTRDYDAYSGGESFRVNFAIRIALAKLLARRAGARLETLVIDEGFGSQDAKGRERLVEAITSVQSDFKQILVVTHIQELKDLFPMQIEISKRPEGSVWAIG
jgi:exonuclease SbcC